MNHPATAPLCHIDELPDRAGRGFSVGEGETIFLVRRGQSIYAYRNVCPHKGLNLDWVPDRFMDTSGEYIHCANHDALFRVEDGLCIAGPCRGARLKAIAFRVSDDGAVALATRITDPGAGRE